MPENETIIGDVAQTQGNPQPAPSSTQGNPQSGPAPSTVQSKSPEPSKPLKKNQTSYLFLAIILIALIVAAAVSLNNNASKNTTTKQTTTNISIQTTAPQNSILLLSAIPLASNMFDYYTYTSNTITIDQYGLPFTQNLISSSTLPSNYTLKIPQSYANVTSPIMVFINISSYPNASSAQSHYRNISKSIANITISNSHSINNSAIYSTNVYGLSLIGEIFQYQNYIVIAITWGNPKTFINSSYVSNIAEKQYSILNNGTK